MTEKIVKAAEQVFGPWDRYAVVVGEWPNITIIPDTVGDLALATLAQRRYKAMGAKTYIVKITQVSL